MLFLPGTALFCKGRISFRAAFVNILIFRAACGIIHKGTERGLKEKKQRIEVEIMQGKWVLFDLDGTLTQSEEGICNCVLYTADRMDLPRPDADTLRKFIGPPLAWSFQEYMGMDPETA